MKNSTNYRKISLIILGIIILVLVIIFVYNIIKKSIKIPESISTQSPFILFPLNPTENLENIIKPTLAQGDCFYSAIYRSLQDKNLLLKFCNSINKDKPNSINCGSEGDFIQSYRNFLANNINFQESYMGLFSQIIIMKKEDPNFKDDFDLMIQYLNVSIQNLLREYNDDNKFVKSNQSNFIKDIMSIIKTRGTYVGEFEVSFTGNILEKYGIQLNIIMKKKNDTDYKSDKEILQEIKDQNSDKNITLILDNDHYEYV